MLEEDGVLVFWDDRSRGTARTIAPLEKSGKRVRVVRGVLVAEKHLKNARICVTLYI